MELISRESATEIIRKYSEEANGELRYHQMVEEIWRLPTYKKVEKAAWIFSPEFGVARCPYCDLEIDMEMIGDFEEYFHYCPNCGKKLEVAG